MTYTKENILELLNNFKELQNQIDKFCDNDYYNHRLNINTSNIEREENTSCNCHPEYEWVHYTTIDEFLKWYKNNQF